MIMVRPLVMLLPFSLVAQGFVVHPIGQRRHTTTRVDAEKKKKGYQFGDLTKSILGNAAKSITGKKDYKFGDITQTVVKEVTGKEDYKFGDISKALDKQAKTKVAEYTGKQDYKVGDISQEVLKRVRTGDYKLDDVLLMCKILVTVGAGFSPLAGALPARVLLEILNVSVAQEVSSKVLEGVAHALDKRFKESVTGDANYQVGDLTKKALMQYMGKDGDDDKYEFGDLSRTVSSKLKENQSLGGVGKAASETKKAGGASAQLDPKLVAELEAWDRSLKLSEEKQ